MKERTRTIWHARCPGCDRLLFVPDTENRPVKMMVLWCYTCGQMVEGEKLSVTGPELTPMMPKVHHVWCNGQRGPVVGCRWCCPLDDDGLPSRDGLWVMYPYDPATGPPEDFGEKHFPGAVRLR